MEPTRKTAIKGHVIEEYIWNGQTIVYVNNEITKLSYDVVVKRFKRFAGIEGIDMDADYAKALDARLSNGLSEDEE